MKEAYKIPLSGLSISTNNLLCLRHHLIIDDSTLLEEQMTHILEILVELGEASLYLRSIILQQSDNNKPPAPPDEPSDVQFKV